MQTEATKGWKKLVAKLSKQRGVKDPSALAAWIMRTKKGGESVTNVPANLIEQAANGVDIRKLISELHDPYDEGEFQEGLRKVGEMLVKACRSLDDLRTMIGLPSESAKQLDDATSQCSEAVKSVKVMLHDSMNPPQADPDPATADAPKPDLEDDTDDDDPDRADVYKPDADECGDPMLGEPQRSQQEKRKRKESKRGRKHEHVERSIIEQVAAGADPYLTVKHLNESMLGDDPPSPAVGSTVEIVFFTETGREKQAKVKVVKHTKEGFEGEMLSSVSATSKGEKVDVGWDGYEDIWFHNEG